MDLGFRLFLAGIFSGALTAYAQAPQNDIAAAERLLKTYGDSWAIKDPAARLMKLQKIWCVDGSHESPFGLSSGIPAIAKEIDGFVKAYPDTKIQFTNVQRTGKNILATFIARNPDGSIVLQGIDYIEVNEGGQLKKVVAFIRPNS